MSMICAVLSRVRSGHFLADPLRFPFRSGLTLRSHALRVRSVDCTDSRILQTRSYYSAYEKHFYFISGVTSEMK